MGKVLITFLISFAISFDAMAQPSKLEKKTIYNNDTEQLSLNIGNTLFALYHANFQKQIALITMLKYCRVNARAEEVIESFPSLPTYFLKRNPEQLLRDIIYKEALKMGVDLKSENAWDLLAKQSLIAGQSFFSGYLKGYQVAMETLVDKTLMEEFCAETVDKAVKNIKKESPAQKNR
jgi:hypothetical protein